MLSQTVTTGLPTDQAVSQAAPIGPQALTLLIFKITGQRYGLPITAVVRIIEMVTITRLPEAPEIIQGIINLHGKAVPVMNLHRRFGLAQPAYGLHTPIILADAGYDYTLGLIVDEVELVLDVPSQQLELIEAIVPTELSLQMASRSAYLTGVAKVDRQMILILNVQALLQPVEQARLAQVLTR